MSFPVNSSLCLMLIAIPFMGFKHSIDHSLLKSRLSLPVSLILSCEHTTDMMNTKRYLAISYMLPLSVLAFKRLLAKAFS